MDTKYRLQVAALRLFAVEGLKGVTLDDILNESGVKKGSFYYYYKAKEELLNDSLKMFFEPVIQIRRERLENYTGGFQEGIEHFYRSVREETQELMATILETDISSRDIGFLMMEGIRSNEFAKESFQLNQRKIKEILKKKIDEAKNDGSVPKGIETGELLTMIITIGEGTLYLSSWNEQLYDYGEILRVNFKQLWNYLDILLEREA